MKKLCVMVIERGDCTGLKNLKISGKDLKELGIQAGRQLGMILQELLDEVLDNPQLNNADYLNGRALELAGQQRIFGDTV